MNRLESYLDINRTPISIFDNRLLVELLDKLNKFFTDYERMSCFFFPYPDHVIGGLIRIDVEAVQFLQAEHLAVIDALEHLRVQKLLAHASGFSDVGFNHICEPAEDILPLAASEVPREPTFTVILNFDFSSNNIGPLVDVLKIVAILRRYRVVFGRALVHFKEFCGVVYLLLLSVPGRV